MHVIDRHTRESGYPRVRGDDDGRVNGCEFARLEFLANFHSRARPNTLYGFQAEPLGIEGYVGMGYRSMDSPLSETGN